MTECDSRLVAFVVRWKLNRFAVKENDNITNTLGLRAYYQNQYNTVFQDCYVAPTEFSVPAHKSRPSFPQPRLLRPSFPRPSLHRPSLPAPAPRHVKPLEVVMYQQLHQAARTAVKLPGNCQNAGCCIDRTLQFVGDDVLFGAPAPERTTLQ